MPFVSGQKNSMPSCEVVYVDERQAVFHKTLVVEKGCRIAEALALSGLFDAYPETQSLPVGVFAKPVSLEALVQEGDRIEIYRPLRLDPKEKRRLKARGRS